MPISFDLKPEHNLVICRHVGAIDDEEFIGSYRALFESGRFEPSMDLVVDLRRADSSNRSQEAIQEFAGYLKEWMHRSEKKSRVAVIAPRDVSYGLARMYEAYSESAQLDFNVFRDEDAAVKWLGIPKEVIE